MRLGDLIPYINNDTFLKLILSSGEEIFLRTKDTFFALSMNILKAEIKNIESKSIYLTIEILEVNHDLV